MTPEDFPHPQTTTLCAARWFQWAMEGPHAATRAPGRLDRSPNLAVGLGFGPWLSTCRGSSSKQKLLDWERLLPPPRTSSGSLSSVGWSPRLSWGGSGSGPIPFLSFLLSVYLKFPLRNGYQVRQRETGPWVDMGHVAA